MLKTKISKNLYQLAPGLKQIEPINNYRDKIVCNRRAIRVLFQNETELSFSKRSIVPINTK